MENNDKRIEYRNQLKFYDVKIKEVAEEAKTSTRSVQFFFQGRESKPIESAIIKLILKKQSHQQGTIYQHQTALAELMN